MFLKSGEYIRTGATLRQQGVLDVIERAITGLPHAPAHWAVDLYKSIGQEGVDKALAGLKEARESAGKASGVIDLYINSTLTRTIQHLMSL